LEANGETRAVGPTIKSPQATMAIRFKAISLELWRCPFDYRSRSGALARLNKCVSGREQSESGVDCGPGENFWVGAKRRNFGKTLQLIAVKHRSLRALPSSV
jgi:hypothetical protein